MLRRQRSRKRTRTFLEVDEWPPCEHRNPAAPLVRLLRSEPLHWYMPLVRAYGLPWVHRRPHGRMLVLPWLRVTAGMAPCRIGPSRSALWSYGKDCFFFNPPGRAVLGRVSMCRGGHQRIMVGPSPVSGRASTHDGRASALVTGFGAGQCHRARLDS